MATSEWSDLLSAFVAKIAELERKRIRARIMAGLERAKSEGSGAVAVLAIRADPDCGV